jgi:hypothetical protein
VHRSPGTSVLEGELKEIGGIERKHGRSSLGIADESLSDKWGINGKRAGDADAISWTSMVLGASEGVNDKSRSRCQRTRVQTWSKGYNQTIGMG